MNPSPEAITFEKATIGTVVFTPETLKNTYETEVVGQLLISETRSDLVSLEDRVEIAKAFIQLAYITSLDQETKIYKLSDKLVAILIVVYGEDVVTQLFNNRFFEFKKKK